ncbi:ADP-forming succinate--CoA ligase subunit beta [Candidatus Bathyarchaeota archaeon]|nr:ADP-forming succinate--CoA ligase subunit beta [Candidatus Bathyarchaeota archaeon]
MKLQEYEAKEIFKKYGIPTPPGIMVTEPTSAKNFIENLSKPVAIKAQVSVGGRGKAGGIKFANTPSEVYELTQQMLNEKIKDLPVRKILVEEKILIKKEIYIGITIDRNSKCFVIITSASGGMDIEEVAEKQPEKIMKTYIDPINGLRSYHSIGIAKRLGYSGKKMTDLASIILRLYKVAVDMDAELTEINPLVELEESFVAADARLNIDNNALYRHKEYEARLFESYEGELTQKEIEGRKMDLIYVELDGDIGIIGNGAGLTMATLDTVMINGGKAGNFLDLGGGANPERISKAVEFVLNDDRVKALFVNVLGGITRCDDTAKGIVSAQNKLNSKKPIVVRMMGTNEEEGKKILSDAGIKSHDTMEEAADMVVKIARGINDG